MPFVASRSLPAVRPLQSLGRHLPQTNQMLQPHTLLPHLKPSPTYRQFQTQRKAWLHIFRPLLTGMATEFQRSASCTAVLADLDNISMHAVSLPYTWLSELWPVVAGADSSALATTTDPSIARPSFAKAYCNETRATAGSGTPEAAPLRDDL